MADTERVPVLETKKLGISFGGLKAVNDFNIKIYQGELIGLMAQRRQIFQDSLTGRQAVRAVLTHGVQSGKRALYRSRSFSRSAVKAAKASLSPVNLYLFSAAGNVPALTSAM